MNILTSIIQTVFNVVSKYGASIFLFISGWFLGKKSEENKILKTINKENEQVHEIQEEVQKVETTTKRTKEDIIRALENGDFK